MQNTLKNTQRYKLNIIQDNNYSIVYLKFFNTVRHTSFDIVTFVDDPRYRPWTMQSSGSRQSLACA